MPPNSAPHGDFAKGELPLSLEPAGSVWQRIYRAHHDDPLGHAPGLSRFSDLTGTKFDVDYLGSTAKVAFAEAVLRDRAVGTMEPFLLTTGELNSYVCADIELAEPLNLVDLTGDGRPRIRTPTDVTGAMDQTLARVWSEVIFRHPAGADGVVYPLRLNGERNIALYDRALGKLAVRAAPRLIERRDELAAIIGDFNLAIA
jgi:hypothetical protein